MATPLVEFRSVVKRFRDFVAVERVNFTIEAGEFVAIMGPSGCGKTTTLRMLAGLEAPSEGEVLMDGRVMNDVPAHDRDTPLVWQSLALFPFLNARENVEFGLQMRGVSASERRRRALEWLDRMEIAEFAERDIASLSGGQKQRVALARSLVIEPRILLLDEPLSALDANLVIRMQSVLTKLQRELGITFVYVTHSQSEAFAMADRVVIMSRGHIAQVGPPKDIYRAPANRFVAEFVGRNNIISGTVTKTTVKSVTIDGSLGSFTVRTGRQDTPRKGDVARFVVAADLAQISLTRPRTGNSIACSLISEEFIGSVVTLFLEAEDGSELKVQLQERELSKMDLKSLTTVYLSWATDQAHYIGAE
ncbi:MAG: ABC transporter ATP-binding protein [Pseudomonadota bacterium]|nr:ABC transporter ATP-binding protein [Pseudomonadota bacterium]